jgi:hypothetical protein
MRGAPESEAHIAGTFLSLSLSLSLSVCLSSLDYVFPYLFSADGANNTALPHAVQSVTSRLWL